MVGMVRLDGRGRSEDGDVGWYRPALRRLPESYVETLSEGCAEAERADEVWDDANVGVGWT